MQIAGATLRSAYACSSAARSLKPSMSMSSYSLACSYRPMVVPFADPGRPGAPMRRGTRCGRLSVPSGMGKAGFPARAGWRWSRSIRWPNEVAPAESGNDGSAAAHAANGFATSGESAPPAATVRAAGHHHGLS